MQNHVTAVAVLLFLASGAYALAGMASIGALAVGALVVDEQVPAVLMALLGSALGGLFWVLTVVHGVAGVGS